MSLVEARKNLQALYLEADKYISIIIDFFQLWTNLKLATIVLIYFNQYYFLYSNLWEFKNLSTNSKTLLIENQFLHNELSMHIINMFTIYMWSFISRWLFFFYYISHGSIFLEHTQSVCESQKEIIVNLRSRISYFQDHDAPLEVSKVV